MVDYERCPHNDHSPHDSRATEDGTGLRYVERRLAELGARLKPHKRIPKGVKYKRSIYGEMLKEQDGKCAICQKEVREYGHIDHCHTSGLVRAILCRTCNVGLGMFDDNPERLESAARYAREHATRASEIAAEIAATRPNIRLCAALKGLYNAPSA